MNVIEPNLEAERIIELSQGVIFNSLKRTLSRQDIIVTLSENENCLLKMLLIKTRSKKEVMAEVWEGRGVIVTDSSYYKLVRQLRQSFKNAGIDEDVIITLPRIGIAYTGEQQLKEPSVKKRVSKLMLRLRCIIDRLSNNIRLLCYLLIN